MCIVENHIEKKNVKLNGSPTLIATYTNMSLEMTVFQASQMLPSDRNSTWMPMGLCNYLGPLKRGL